MVNARQAIESLYTGTFNAYLTEDIVDPVTHQTTQQYVKVLEDIPCRLSYYTISSLRFTYERRGIPTIDQTIKLFFSPDINVPAGSRLEITQNGQTTFYKQSGFPATHSNHKEILVQLEEDYG